MEDTHMEKETTNPEVLTQQSRTKTNTLTSEGEKEGKHPSKKEYKGKELEQKFME